MKSSEILAAAKEAPAKVRLEDYREAVQVLRDKGFTWREVADFLTERGVQTDHTRVYRMFGETKEERRTTSQEVEIERTKFLGEKLTKRKKTWNVMELELPSKLGESLTVLGYAWGDGTAQYKVADDESLTLRDATLVIRSGNKGFPVAYIKAEILSEQEDWIQQDIYIVPNWEGVLGSG